MRSSRTAVLTGSLLIAAACSDDATRPSPESPALVPAVDIATIASDFVIDAASGEELAALPDVGVEEAATGGRASGRADVVRQFAISVAEEKYSFVGLSTEPSPGNPFAAKGEFSAQRIITFRATGDVTRQTIHADINCLRIMGNNAVASGPMERFIVNGRTVTFPFPIQVVFQVRDMGEGPDASFDLASAPVLTSFSAAPACTVFNLPMLVSRDGNIQVEQR